MYNHFPSISIQNIRKGCGVNLRSNVTQRGISRVIAACSAYISEPQLQLALKWDMTRARYDRAAAPVHRRNTPLADDILLRNHVHSGQEPVHFGR